MTLLVWRGKLRRKLKSNVEMENIGSEDIGYDVPGVGGKGGGIQ